VETIQAQYRENGRGNTIHQMRNEGWVPAVLYGPEAGNRKVKVRERDLNAALRQQATNKPFRLIVDGEQYDVMVYELQRHPVQGNILHADFKQINMNEKVHTSVPVLISGEPELGVATLVRHSVEISCLPGNIPESFYVDVSGLQVGDVVLAQDLQVPQGVEMELDPLEVLVSILPAKAASDESVEAEQEAKETAMSAAANNQER